MPSSVEFENHYRSSEKLVELLKKDRGKLEPRVGAGIIDGFHSDYPLLRLTALDALGARRAKKTATLGQDEAAQRLAGRVMAGRGAIKGGKLNKEIQTRAGVGRPMNTKTVKTVLDGAQALVEAYTQFPNELRSVGILPADIEQIQALSAALSTKDSMQEQAKLTSMELTRQRNAALKRVKDAISVIIGAAGMQFVDDPDRLALYQAILPTTKNSAKPAAPKA
ncbi:MAG: hypothetical protein CVU59_03430 [Deltaproteobacteria bacterium HGW-Deltaproteobacteria-17]|nr:MAG: hypothetical protein CVU59_03430 [Deltaproteobacteria bacterium HGW-Deltaproteobacteria-17]